MASLTWSGNEGYDSTGRRVASVVRYSETPFHAVLGDPGPGFVLPRRSYWEAYVAFDGRFDRVLVDGNPGRWVEQDEAKAAAELAHRAR